MVERIVEAELRHGEAALARPCEEVGDEGVQPEVVALGIRRPQAEGAVGALPRHLLVDGRLDAAVEIGIDGQMLGAGEPVGVEQRHGAAHDLLGAAVGIAVERLQHGRRVDGAEGRDRQRQRACARHEALQRRIVDPGCLSGREIGDAAGIDVGRARRHAEREALRAREAGAAHVEIERGGSRRRWPRSGSSPWSSRARRA